MMTSLWASGSAERLGQLAREIEQRDSWRSFLTAHEHKLFQEALEAGPETWALFLDGKIACQLQVTESVIPQSETSSESPSVSTVNIDPVSLAFRVRYMLYERSISVMYNYATPEDISPSLLDGSIANGLGTTAIKRNSDEDYDDEYDDDEEPEPAPETVPSVLIAKVEEEAEPDMHAHRETLLNYHKMYHTFETDRESVLRFKKLQDSNRQMDAETEAGSKSSIERLASTAQFGAANLSLKHLLATIDNKRDELGLTDVELRNLISDVRKNRSKWANEDRVGQEELYEACERVVQDLRATTEHSTAFLNRVNKRDAPNYYDIITTPMDLNTVMKKLKGLQYNSKKEFIDDLMLIWSNCLTYNSDPKHFLRAHAIAMRKKTVALAPLIPDIAVRDRAEVEAEAQAEAQAEQDQTDEVRGKGAKGVKRKLNKDGEPEQPPSEPKLASGTPAAEAVVKEEPDSESSRPSSDGNATAHSDSVAPVQSPTMSVASGAGVTEAETVEDTPAPGTPEAEDDSELLARSQEPDDLESVIWTKAYMKQRTNYLYQRYCLFGPDGIDPEAPVPLRKPHDMARFLEVQEMAVKSVHQLAASHRGLNNDEEAVLTEYDVANGLPPPPHPEDPEPPIPLLENLPASRYISRGKFCSIYNRNLNKMQAIRKLCARINLIRDLQSGSTVAAQMQPPEYAEITEPEEDVSSRLPLAEPLYGPSSVSGLRRSVAKIAMHTGFESSQLTALDTLTEIAGDYMTNLARLYKDSLDDYEATASPEDRLVHSFRSMGISRPDTLVRYMTDDVVKTGRKLETMKNKFGSLLADMLRPTLANYKDDQFVDGSDQFVLGEFSNELGDDYFGFKELGIDKELGVGNIAVPFHLLQQKVTANVALAGVSHTPSRVQLVPDYPPLTPESISRLPGIVRAYFTDLFAKTPDLVEDDRQPRQRGRPRIPATGRILVKARPMSKAFDKPERIEEPKVDDLSKIDDLTGNLPDLSSTEMPSMSDSFNNTVDHGLLLQQQDSQSRDVEGEDIDLAVNAFETFGEFM